MKTYCIPQGILLNALWWPKWEGNPKRGNIHMCMANSLCCSVEINTVL